MRRVHGGWMALGFALAVVMASAALPLQAQEHKTTAPAVRMVTVENGVELEVLDWGGDGRSLVFLAGLGSTAHDFDSLAPQFTAHHHVYAITRRGFGASSKPSPTVANYSAERLGKDVLIVLQSLKLDHPVLVGHSIAGEELSWIGTFHPEAVGGLIYLEAADSHSFYNAAQTDMVMDIVEVRRQVDAFQGGEPLSPSVLGAIRDSAAALANSSGRLADNVTAAGRSDPAPPPVGLAILFGTERFSAEKFKAAHTPMLAVMGCPHSFLPTAQINPRAAAMMTEKDRVRCTEEVRFLRAQVPSLQVLVVPKADHDIFHSNEAEVVRAMNGFLAKLS